MKRFFLEFLKLTTLGILIGLFIDLYQFLAHFVVTVSNDVFFSSDVTTKAIAIFLGVILIFISYFLLRLEGNIQGSGIAQLKLNKKMKDHHIKWYSALPLMIVNSCISFFLGFPLGSEAPSAFIGGALELGIDKAFSRNTDNDDTTLCAGAGFSAAFLTPLTGIIYTIEEMTHKLTLVNLIKAIYLVFISISISVLCLREPIISFKVVETFDYTFIWVFLILILFNILISVISLISIKHMKMFINKHYKNPIIKYRFFIFAFISFSLFLIYPLCGGSGINLIYELRNNPLWWIILLLLIYRIIMYIFAANSMATGGLFLPGLTLGALNGYLVATLATSIGGFETKYYSIVILIGMVSMLASTSKCPLTATMLAVSLSGGLHSLTIILPITLVTSFLSYLPIRLFKIDDIVDSRLKLLKTTRRKVVR